MVQATTKFNVGDKVVTLSKDTKKMIEITIAQMVVTVKKDSSSVSVYPQNQDGSTDYYTSYEECYCFATRDELINYIKY